MENVSFSLTLEDHVSGAAKKSADALRGVEAAAAKAQKALNFDKEMGRSQASLAKLKADPKGYKEVLELQRKIASERQKLGKEPFFKELGKELTGKFSFGKMFGAAVLADALVEGAKSAVELLSEGIKKAFEAGAEGETERLAYRLSLGKEGGKESLEDISRFSKLTQFSEPQVAKMFLSLRRSGLGQDASRSAFAAAADIQAGGGMKAEEALQAFTHIFLKGGVTSKQLVGMGVNAPEFYKSLGKKKGVSAEEAEKLATHGGKVDPQLLLNTIFEGIEKRQGGKLGTGAVEASKTLESRWNKLTALPEEYLRKVSESPAWQKLSDKLGGLFESLDPEGPRGQKIIASLIGAFSMLGDAVGKLFTPENVELFANGVARVAGYLADLPAVIDKLVMGSEILATIWVGNKIVGMVTVVASALPALGAAAGSIAAIAAPLAAAAVAAAAVATAFYRISSAATELGGWDRVGKDLKDWVGGEQPAVATDSVNDNSPDWKKVKANGGKSITMQAPISINFHGDAGGDSTHTAQKVAQEVHRHAVSALERAANERGAM